MLLFNFMLDLPIIKVLEVRDVESCAVDLEMEDETYDMIVKIGEEEITRNDYFKIGLTSMLEESLAALDNDVEKNKKILEKED